MFREDTVEAVEHLTDYRVSKLWSRMEKQTTSANVRES